MDVGEKDTNYNNKAATRRRRRDKDQDWDKDRDRERAVQHSLSAYSQSSSYSSSERQQRNGVDQTATMHRSSSLYRHASTSSFRASQHSSPHSFTESLSDNHHLTHQIPQQIGRTLFGILSYFCDLLLGALMILRPLLSFILALVILIVLLAALTRSLTVFRSEVQTRIACKIPGVSYLIHCPGDGVTTTDPMMMHIPNFADLVNKQAASYELIADTLSSLNPAFVPKARSGKKTGGGSSSSSSSSDDPEDPYGLSMHNQKGGFPLPLLLKRAELAVVDLKVLVKHSTLPEVGKALLVEKLQMFHTRAKTTSRQLQFLQARANGCVDGLVIRNVYLTLELDRLEEQQLRLRDGRRTGPGGAVAGIWDKVLDFFAAPRDQQIATSEQKLQQLYQATMEDAQNHVRDLIHQSQEVLQSLDTLDQVLLAIHEIATQERRQQNQAHGETLALLWSRLGGNRLQRGVYRDNLELLKEMDGQRKATVGQIQTALWKLTDFEAEIGFLREKIVDASMDAAADGGPQVVGGPSEEGGSKTMPGKMSAAGGMGASLRAHIQQIDLVTSRLKSRSFLADAMMSEQQLEQEGGEERVPGLADMPLHGSQEPPMT